SDLGAARRGLDALAAQRLRAPPVVLARSWVAAGRVTRDPAGWAPDLAVPAPRRARVPRSAVAFPDHRAACALAPCSAHQAAAVPVPGRADRAVVAVARCSVRREVAVVALRLVHLAAHDASRQGRLVAAVAVPCQVPPHPAAAPRGRQSAGAPQADPSRRRAAVSEAEWFAQAEWMPAAS